VLDPGGAPTGVLEVLNKRAGIFTATDEQRLRAFAAQAAIALQNAQLFTDVLALKNYTDSLLRSLPDGVITLDGALSVTGLNDAAHVMLGVSEAAVTGRSAPVLWGEGNPWLEESLAYVARTGHADHRPDVAFARGDGAVVSVNVTAAPLHDPGGAFNGVTVILQNIERQKKVHATITRYMAKEFAEQALSGDGAATAGGPVFATMLFSDIRRFTALAEALTAQATVDMLNEYFSEMAETVQQQGGVLDKFIGDAVMAVFGAPVSGPDDADHAAATARQMIRRLRALNQRRASRGAQPLEIGIGIASGEIVAGPVGSPARKNYTVIGDAVNLAARLESANKHYGTSVLLAGATVERFVAPALLRRIDLIRVKGKEEPTEIYELLDHHEDAMRTQLERVAPAFDEGVRCYRARDWTHALAAFAEVLKAYPNDGPSWVYTDRCLFYRDNPPPERWDGVWTMKTK
jgi:adenylate cyclase